MVKWKKKDIKFLNDNNGNQNYSDISGYQIDGCKLVCGSLRKPYERKLFNSASIFSILAWRAEKIKRTYFPKHH